jgi:hypothetical protein
MSTVIRTRRSSRASTTRPSERAAALLAEGVGPTQVGATGGFAA